MKKPFLVLAVLIVAALAVAQGDGTPAFHAAPPKAGAKLPPILAEDQLWGQNFQYAYQKRAYQLAAKIPKLIYQLPCYCYCDRMGHSSLRSCYETTHAANCSHCLKELYYAYAQTKKGRTPSHIRQGIVKGEWRDLDLQTAADQSMMSP